MQVDKYLQNTHAKTHSTYTLTLVDLFTVSRAGEDERFKAFFPWIFLAFFLAASFTRVIMQSRVV